MALVGVFCTQNPTVSDSGSVTTNALLVRVREQDGSGAAGSEVRLYPPDYNPMTDSLPASLRTTADDSGFAVLKAVPVGVYNLYATHAADAARSMFLKTSVVVSLLDTATVEDTLGAPGAVLVPLGDSMRIAGAAVYMPGSPIFTVLDSQSISGGFAFLLSVPVTENASIAFLQTAASSEKALIADSLTVPSGDTVVAFSRTQEPGSFPFGVFQTESVDSGVQNEPSLWYASLFSILKANHIHIFRPVRGNDQAKLLSVLDQAQQEGIRAIVRGEDPGPGSPFHQALQHPAVNWLSLFYNNATNFNNLQTMYTDAKRYYGKPILIIIPGEEFDNAANPARVVWETLKPEIRTATHNPFRGSFDLVQTNPAGLPFDTFCNLMEQTEAQTPWWLVLQAFGQSIVKTSDSSCILPSAAELSAMVHTALAYGARGILAFQIDTPRDRKDFGLLDTALQPQVAWDGSRPFEAYGVLGLLLKTHAAVLSRLVRDSIAVQTTIGDITALPRHDPIYGSRYLYVANRNASQTHTPTIRIASAQAVSEAVDLYTGAVFAVIANGTQKEIAPTLSPGQGRLLVLQ